MSNTYRNKLNMTSLIFILGVAFTIAFLALFFKSHRHGTSNAEQRTVKKIDQQKSGGLETFYLPIISRRLKKVKLGELKNEMVPEGAKEARIWVGFSHYGFNGLILKSDKTNWSAIYIPDPDFDKALPSSQAFRLLSPPKSGWQELSTKLQQLGLYDLPGEPDKVPGRERITDAIAVIIEIKTSSSYRAYGYEGLLYYQGEETKKMEMILDTLSSEFGIELY